MTRANAQLAYRQTSIVIADCADAYDLDVTRHADTNLTTVEVNQLNGRCTSLPTLVCNFFSIVVSTVCRHASCMSSPPPQIHLVSGACAGLVSSLALQPLDLLKTRLQQEQRLDARHRTTLAAELRKLASVRDAWRGAVPLVLRTLVGAGLFFSTLLQTRAYLARAKPQRGGLSVLPQLSHMENLLAGFFVRGVVGLFTMPITVVKTRFESSAYHYRLVWAGVRGIYGEGTPSARHFFKGTWATLARDCPYAGLYVLFYEGFKNEVGPYLVGTGAAWEAANNSGAAAAAAVVLTMATAPFDAVKTRLQVSRASPLIAQVTRQLLREPGGARNLFSGVSLRLGRKGLSAGISWCIYEELLKWTRHEA